MAAIASASVAANHLGNTGLVGRLGDLSTALTNLVQDPTNAVYKGQALANLDSLISQLTSDPFLSGFTAGLTTARGRVAAAATASPGADGRHEPGHGARVAGHGHHRRRRSTASRCRFRPIARSSQPAAPEVFDIVMTNNGSAATTYDLSVAGLPAGVTAMFSQPTVTLQPGQSIGRRQQRRDPDAHRVGHHARPRQFHGHGDRRGGDRRSTRAPRAC